MTYMQRLIEEINRRTTRNDQLVRNTLEAINRINSSFQIPRIYDVLQTLDNSFLRRALDVSHEIQKVVQSVSIWHDAHSQQIAEMTRTFDVLSRKMSADLAVFRLSFQRIISSDIFSNLFRILQRE